MNYDFKWWRRSMERLNDKEHSETFLHISEIWYHHRKEYMKKIHILEITKKKIKFSSQYCMSHPVGYFRPKFSNWPHLTPTWPWVRISLLECLTPEQKFLISDLLLENFDFFVISRIWKFFRNNNLICSISYALFDGDIRFPLSAKKVSGCSFSPNLVFFHFHNVGAERLRSFINHYYNKPSEVK